MRSLLVLALLCAGCKEPRVIYQRVEVPIAVPCPEPPYLAWPDLPIDHMDRYQTPAEQAKAWVLSVEILRATLWQSIRLLDAYRVKSLLPPRPTR